MALLADRAPKTWAAALRVADSGCSLAGHFCIRGQGPRLLSFMASLQVL